MARLRGWRLAVLLAVAAVLVAGAILIGYRIPLSSERLRREVIATLSDRLESEVELASLELRPFPRMEVTGSGLVLRHKRRLDVPLIAVRSFQVTADLRALLRKRIANVRLEGLEIQIARGRLDDLDGSAPSGRRTEAGPEELDGSTKNRQKSQVIIEHLVAESATVTVIPRDPAKRPKVWRLHELHMQSVGLDQPMPFQSRLTNAVPPGTVETEGVFGPWDASEPGQTPVDGHFTFDKADLGVFKGISGTLNSRGTYAGTLERIVADGKTVTPDFTLDVSDHAVSLQADYEVIVDGTNGDTTLSRIEGAFLNTSFTASGSVTDPPGDTRRTVELDIDMPKARLEDVLWLAVKTPKPTMTGALALRAALELPPGDENVVEKLNLKGEFTIEDGRFTNAAVQNRINALSGRASGRSERTPHVASTFRGEFSLDEGRLRLAPLRFDIPGALVDIRGEYALRRETLSFAGQVLMDAKISQTVTGWKAWLLKPVDPLFRRNGRTFIPITIRGTRNDPKFGVDVKRIFNKDAPPKLPQP